MKARDGSKPIDLNLIDEDPTNIRVIQPDKADDEALSESLHAQGLLQPILVRAHPDKPGRFMVVAGGRRWRAARGLMWGSIDAIVVHDITAADAMALQAVENAQRAAMHPIDTWRAMVAMQERGSSLKLAAQCLGVTEREARQLDKLGRIAPELIEEMRETGVPDEQYLSRIANAPHNKQLAAFKSRDARRGGEVSWWAIARALETATFSRTDAIFDADASGLAWQKDVFAEPGSDEEWTTADRDGFLRCQTEALKAEIAAKQKKGHAVEFAEWDPKTYNIKMPTGYRQTWEKPRWTKAPAGDTRKLLRAIDDKANVKAIAAELIGRLVVVTNPAMNIGSGRVAEAIGLSMDAYAQMPRLDTEEFLKTVRLPVLISLTTSQREEDVLRILWSAYNGHAIRVRQGKSRHLHGEPITLVIPALPPLRERLAAIERKHAVICLTANGNPWRPDHFRHRFAEVRAELGLADDLHFHGLRHTCLTVLAEHGATGKQLQGVSGHRTLSQTDRYTKHADRAGAAAGAFDNLFKRFFETG